MNYPLDRTEKSLLIGLPILIALGSYEVPAKYG
jgi:hypothetical protein